MPRDDELEQAFLAAAEQHAGVTGYAARVRRRLDAGEQLYGADAFRRRTPLELLDELREEAADLGGWAVLLAQVLNDDPQLAAPRARRARTDLQRVAAIGAVIDEVLARLARDLA